MQKVMYTLSIDSRFLDLVHLYDDISHTPVVPRRIGFRNIYRQRIRSIQILLSSTAPSLIYQVGVRSAGNRHRSFEMKIANGWPKYDVFWRSIEIKIATIVQRGTICRRSKEIKIAVAFAPVIFAKPNFFCFFVTNYLPHGTSIINPKRS